MDFKTYLKQEKITPEDAAKALKKTKAYVHMLIAESCTPSLHLAALIEHWSGNKVTMQSWINWKAIKKAAKS